MSPETLVLALRKKGVHITRSGNELNFWPTSAVTAQDLSMLKHLKAEVCVYLKGYYALKSGKEVCTHNDKYIFVQIFEGLGRACVHPLNSKSQLRYFDLSEISSGERIKFLADRQAFIEFSVEDGDRTNSNWELYKAEWHYLIEELAREYSIVKSRDFYLKAVSA